MFSIILSFFTGGFLKIFLFIKNNPKPFIYAAISLALFFGGFFYSKSHWQNPLLEKISIYQKAEQTSHEKKEKIEKEAKISSEKAENEIKEKNKKIDELVSKYEEEKNKKPKIIYKVKDPRDEKKTVEIEFNTSGNLICDRFSDEYAKTLNLMIDEANKK